MASKRQIKGNGFEWLRRPWLISMVALLLLSVLMLRFHVAQGADAARATSSIVRDTDNSAQAPLKAKPITLDEVDAEALQEVLLKPVVHLNGRTSNKRVRASDFANKPLVLNFWATWCPPCVEEMPDLDALAKAYPEINVVGYAIDLEENISRFLTQVPVDYPILVGDPLALKAMRQVGNPAGGLPFTLIFDRGAALSYRIVGQVDAQELHDLVESMVRP